MTRTVALIVAVLALVAVAAGVIIGSQDWGLATTALVGLCVTWGLTAIGIAIAMRLEHNGRSASRVRAARV